VVTLKRGWIIGGRQAPFQREDSWLPCARSGVLWVATKPVRRRAWLGSLAWLLGLAPSLGLAKMPALSRPHAEEPRRRLTHADLQRALARRLEARGRAVGPHPSRRAHACLNLCNRCSTRAPQGEDAMRDTLKKSYGSSL